MNLLVDMNLSPAWCEALQRHGIHAVHWSDIGDPTAPDRAIAAWARENRHVVFTNDLDFGALLALTRSGKPSVIQVRAQDVTPRHLLGLVVEAINQHEIMLEGGALISLEESSARARILPLT